MTTEGKDSGVVVTAVSTTAPDVESQKQQQQTAASAAANSEDDNAGKGLGIAMFVLLIVALICTFIPILAWVAFICVIIVIFMASAITCNCCCASDLNLKPHVKRFSTATLVCLCLLFIVQIIYVIGVVAAMGTEVANTGTISQSTTDGATAGAVAMIALSIVFNILALIFSALFTWGRGCCAPSS